MLAPSSKLSATIRAFSSTVHRRRRRCPVITSIRRYEPSSCLPSGMPFAIAHLLRSAHAELYRRRTARCPGGGLLPVTIIREQCHRQTAAKGDKVGDLVVVGLELVLPALLRFQVLASLDDDR